MIPLRQSTSRTIPIGPFVDATDGVTPETALTINAADLRLSKNGAAFAAKNSGGGTHSENGYYSITLDATDTNTIGHLRVAANVTGAAPVWQDFMVMHQKVWDMLYASEGKLGWSTDMMIIGTVDTVTNTHTPTTTEFQADDITEATADHFIGRNVLFISGNLIRQVTNITDYVLVGGIGQFTVAAMTEAPANDDQFIIV